MSEENEINTYDMLAYYAKLMREDYISKKALREWCEFEISWWSNEHAGYDERLRLCMLAMHREILGRFCKEGER